MFEFRVKVYVINAGHPGQYFGLKGADDGRILYDAPNNWKTRNGAVRWAVRNGLTVVD